jgi:hypothetical protein
MRKIVSLAIITVVLCSFIPVFLLSAYAQAVHKSVPNVTVDCENNYCFAEHYWGGGQSYGARNNIPGGSCAAGGCFAKSNAYLYYELVGDDYIGAPYGGGIFVGLMAQSSAAPKQSPCYGYDAGIYWFVQIINTGNSVTADDCWPQDSDNAGHSYQVEFSRYFEGSGGYNIWITGTTGGHQVCNPCGYPFDIYGEPDTMDYTENMMEFYDISGSTTPLNGVAWLYNQFQKTDGSWNYQTRNGNFAQIDGYAQMWWYITPGNSKTGGNLDACVSATVNHSGCTND